MRRLLCGLTCWALLGCGVGAGEPQLPAPVEEAERSDLERAVGTWRLSTPQAGFEQFHYVFSQTGAFTSRTVRSVEGCRTTSEHHGSWTASLVSWPTPVVVTMNQVVETRAGCDDGNGTEERTVSQVFDFKLSFDREELVLLGQAGETRLTRL